LLLPRRLALDAARARKPWLLAYANFVSIVLLVLFCVVSADDGAYGHPTKLSGPIPKLTNVPAIVRRCQGIAILLSRPALPRV
jgi:hypothetical protein